ncbi:hypothetical protein BJ322DRAFT_1056526 [Thelephora terrestris]|uniref:Uncharacterized protein n=1 Tax=Thelephora terrestris TaxID=56493 RepID=A0A9P6L7M0_9AGAM|nr:hypothetical protein BJ322DRAFT_1056526 [Thelephora terrestris]
MRSVQFPFFPQPPPPRSKFSHPLSMPTRPNKSLARPVLCLDRVLLNTRSDNQLPPPPPSVPPVAESNPLPRSADTPQRVISLVVRNTRKSRNTSFYTPIPRSNHYLLSKTFVENNQPPRPLAPEKKLRENSKTKTSRLCPGTPSPGVIIPDFIWRFSAPYLDSKTRGAFAALKSCDPDTFTELVAGDDWASVDDIQYTAADEDA